MQASLPAAALKVPLAHTVQTRSDDAPGAAVSYSPMPHVAMAWHTRSDELEGAAKVKWPSGQEALCVLQSRSLVAVGSAFSNSPDLQVVTATHALPSLAAEYVVPGTHAAHWRSAEAEPAAVMPRPAAHADQSVQEAWSAVAVNLPSAHAVHTRSLLAVAPASVNVPAVQLVWAVVQALPLSAAENVEPARQASQTRSAVAEPAVSWPWPAAHVAHGAQELSPATAVKVPLAQSAHVRSFVEVGAVSSYVPGAQLVLRSWQVSSLSALENVPVVHAVQIRSVVAEPTVECP